MTVNTTRTGSADVLDTRLLVLDPDFEPLFAEVDSILCEALAPRSRARCASVPVPGSEPAPDPMPGQYYRRWRGRRPTPGRATQRGPPPCRISPKVKQRSRNGGDAPIPTPWEAHRAVAANRPDPRTTGAFTIPGSSQGLRATPRV